MMDQITSQLFIGSWQDAAPHRNQMLQHHGITAVVNLAGDHDDGWALFPTVFYHKIGLIDGGGNPEYALDAAVDLVDRLISQGEKVLVHCISGVSRSCYVSLRVLAPRLGRSHQDTYDMIKAMRPRTEGMSPFFKELLQVT